MMKFLFQRPFYDLVNSQTSHKLDKTLRFAFWIATILSLLLIKINMYGYNDFHESYHNHSCSIIPERDVLDIDIVGTGFVARSKRWWYNLFLLSYTDDRSRTFYNSSHAMRMERINQFRRYSSRIHPLSKFRTSWDWLLLHVFIAKIVIFHFTSTILFDGLCMGFYYTVAMLELVIIVDLFVAFRTGYINKGIRRVVLNPEESTMHYCSTKLFLHVASAIPLNWIMFLRFGTDINCGLCKANYFVCFLKIMSIFSLYRVYEVSPILTGTRPSAKTDVLKFVRVGTLGLVTMVQFFDISDMVCLLFIMNAGEVTGYSSYFKTEVIIKYADEPAIKASQNIHLAMLDLVRIIKSLLLFSFELYRLAHHMDIVSSLIAYVIANCFYLWSVTEAYALVNRFKYSDDQHLMIKHSALNLLECRQLPDQLRSKVEQYFDFNMTKYKIIEIVNGLYQSVPSALKREVILNRYCRHLTRIPHFKEWPLEIVEELVLMLKRQFYLKNDVVADAWVQGDGLMVVEVGVLAVYSARHAEVGHLIDGDYFGEISLVTDREVRMSHIIAITSCSVLILRKAAFRMCMRKYPKLFFEMKKSLEKSHNKALASSM